MKVPRTHDAQEFGEAILQLHRDGTVALEPVPARFAVEKGDTITFTDSGQTLRVTDVKPNGRSCISVEVEPA